MKTHDMNRIWKLWNIEFNSEGNTDNAKGLCGPASRIAAGVIERLGYQADRRICHAYLVRDGASICSIRHAVVVLDVEGEQWLFDTTSSQFGQWAEEFGGVSGIQTARKLLVLLGEGGDGYLQTGAYDLGHGLALVYRFDVPEAEYHAEQDRAFGVETAETAKYWETLTTSVWRRVRAGEKAAIRLPGQWAETPMTV